VLPELTADDLKEIGVAAVVIAPGTRRLTGGLFEYADLGVVEIKGLGAPVAVARVVRESAPFTTGLSPASSPRSGQEAPRTPAFEAETEFSSQADRHASEPRSSERETAGTGARHYALQ
jgi:hypothetical protein